MKSLIKKILKEELGVPSNIVNVAKQIFSDILYSIKDTQSVETMDGEDIVIKNEYQVGDLTINKVDFKFEYRYDKDLTEPVIAAMSTGGKSKITKDFKIKSKISNDRFTLNILLVVSKKMKGIDIKNYMEKERIEFISSITHELKHRYDAFKKPKTSISGRAKYTTYTNKGFGNIDPINRFLQDLYFVHTIENLVRPSEIAAAIDAGEITKKGFYDFLLNHNVYKRLKEINGFTYQGLRKDLENYVDKIKVLFDMNGIDYEGQTDDEIIDTTLDLVLINVRQWEGEIAQHMLSSHPLEVLFGFEGEKKVFFDNYLKKLMKYDGESKKYFEYEEKMFKFVSSKMIRKISKLYAMAKDVKTESIINWVLWQKFNGSNNQIVTEYKFKPKK